MSAPGIGHNSEPGGIAADRLRSIVERIERVEEEQKDRADAKKDIYAEAKSAGFDTSTVRKLVALRKKDRADAEEQATLLSTYGRALGLDFL
jgi:uncharacterized protein (UPF0335 family)